MATVPAVTPDSSILARNARCRACNCGSVFSNIFGGIGSAAFSSSKNTSCGSPASAAVSNSSSVYDTSGRSRTGVPYRNPISPTYTSQPRTWSWLY